LATHKDVQRVASAMAAKTHICYVADLILGTLQGVSAAGVVLSENSTWYLTTVVLFAFPKRSSLADKGSLSWRLSNYCLRIEMTCSVYVQSPLSMLIALETGGFLSGPHNLTDPDLDQFLKTDCCQ